MDKTKQIILLAAGILLIGLASYYFDRRSTGEENQNIDANRQEISQTEPEQVSQETVVKQEPEKESPAPKIEEKTKVNPENTGTTAETNKNQTLTFTGKIYSTPKDDAILSKYDDYFITDSGEKYGLQAADMIGIEGLHQIISDVIVSYRDTGRTAQIKGVLFEPADDVSGRQIRIEEIKDITN